MRKNWIESLIGLAVLGVAAWFFIYAYKTSGAKPQDGYSLIAKFDSVAGVTTGSDVRIGGIKVGTVTNMVLDPETYLAKLTLTIARSVSVPGDSTAAIVSDGLLGSKYVSLTPGSEETMLDNGGEITITQSSISLETLIGKFMFNGSEGKGGDAKPAETAPPAAPAASPEAAAPQAAPAPAE